jgi:hypothetical protein
MCNLKTSEFWYPSKILVKKDVHSSMWNLKNPEFWYAPKILGKKPLSVVTLPRPWLACGQQRIKILL